MNFPPDIILSVFFQFHTILSKSIASFLLILKQKAPLIKLIFSGKKTKG